MLNTFIKNRGMSQTVILDNNQNQINEFNQINWDADYDGNIANISIDTDSNGNSNHYNIKLDNNDLDNILNVDSVNIPVDKRLQNDFNERREPYLIKFSTTDEPIKVPDTPPHLKELIDRRISSPNAEDFFLPYSINKRPYKYTPTPKKRHTHLKPYITYKLIKKTKPKYSRKKSSKSKSSKSKSSKSKSSKSKSSKSKSSNL